MIGRKFGQRIDFLHQMGRNIAARRRNAEQMHTHAIGLRDLNPDTQIFVARKNQRVADRLVSSKVDEIGDDQRIDALLLPLAIEHSQAQLDIMRFAECGLFRAGAIIRSDSVVPIYAEQSGIRFHRAREFRYGFNGSFNIEPTFGPGFALPADKHGAGGKQIASIDKNRCLQHFVPPNETGLPQEPLSKRVAKI